MAVSYTHLDVYKRQSRWCARRSEQAFFLSFRYARHFLKPPTAAGRCDECAACASAGGSGLRQNDGADRAYCILHNGAAYESFADFNADIQPGNSRRYAAPLFGTLSRFAAGAIFDDS